MVVEQAVIQTKNIQIDTPQIDVTATELDIQDAPLEISQTAAVVTFAVSPIAVDTAAPADFVKYTDPNPPDKPLLHTIIQAPQPRRNMSALPKAFGEQDTPTIGQPGPMNVNLFGTGDFFFGPEFGSKTTTEPGTREENRRRSQALLPDGLRHAKARGLRVCVGFEVNGDPTVPENQERLVARLTSLMRRRGALPCQSGGFLRHGAGTGGRRRLDGLRERFPADPS